MSNVQLTSHNTQPLITILSEAEAPFDPSTGVSVGRSWYLIVIPKVQMMIGFELKITASHTQKTKIETRFTTLEKSAEIIYEQLVQGR